MYKGIEMMNMLRGNKRGGFLAFLCTVSCDDCVDCSGVLDSAQR
jgi:hypothetical protein